MFYATLQWFKYSKVPNDVTLYTKIRKHLKSIKPHFFGLYTLMTGSKIIAGSRSQVWQNIPLVELCR